MRILAFVDLHGSMAGLKRLKKKAEKADVVVCAGDLTVFEQDIEKMVKFLATIKKPVVIIPGNHESMLLEQLCKKHSSLYFIHKKQCRLGDYQIIGYGGSGFSIDDPEFTRFARKLKKTGEDIILVTHAPPHNTALDLINDSHNGNKPIAEFIRKSKPVLAICGHFHENAGRKDQLGRTIIINPGPEGAIIRIKK